MRPFKPNDTAAVWMLWPPVVTISAHPVDRPRGRHVKRLVVPRGIYTLVRHAGGIEWMEFCRCCHVKSMERSIHVRAVSM